MMKKKKAITGTDVAIICSAIGVIASIILIIMDIIDHESTIAGIGLFCLCMTQLLVNVKNKKDAQ